jgi:hypothetical protein
MLTEEKLGRIRNKLETLPSKLLFSLAQKRERPAQSAKNAKKNFWFRD